MLITFAEFKDLEAITKEIKSLEQEYGRKTLEVSSLELSVNRKGISVQDKLKLKRELYAAQDRLEELKDILKDKYIELAKSEVFKRHIEAKGKAKESKRRAEVASLDQKTAENLIRYNPAEGEKEADERLAELDAKQKVQVQRHLEEAEELTIDELNNKKRNIIAGAKNIQATLEDYLDEFADADPATRKDLQKNINRLLKDFDKLKLDFEEVQLELDEGNVQDLEDIVGEIPSELEFKSKQTAMKESLKGQYKIAFRKLVQAEQTEADEDTLNTLEEQVDELESKLLNRQVSEAELEAIRQVETDKIKSRANKVSAKGLEKTINRDLDACQDELDTLQDVYEDSEIKEEARQEFLKLKAKAYRNLKAYKRLANYDRKAYQDMSDKYTELKLSWDSIAKDLSEKETFKESAELLKAIDEGNIFGIKTPKGWLTDTNGIVWSTNENDLSSYAKQGAIEPITGKAKADIVADLESNGPADKLITTGNSTVKTSQANSLSDELAYFYN